MRSCKSRLVIIRGSSLKAIAKNDPAEWPVSREEEHHMDLQEQSLKDSRQSERSIRTQSSGKMGISDKFEFKNCELC